MTTDTTESQDNAFTTVIQIFQILTWILCATLAVNAGSTMHGELMAMDMTTQSFSGRFNHFSIALLTTLPAILLAWAMFDMARFYGRCADGDVFSRRNVKTLKVASESLFWAAAISAVIAPTVISWLERKPVGILWHTDDLSLGVAAIGVALYGFALVLARAVELKEENDEIV